MTVKSYRELIAWQKAMSLIEAVYLATRTFPKEELYGLTLQMRRASVSIPSNVAEGQGRNPPRSSFTTCQLLLDPCVNWKRRCYCVQD